MCYEIFKHGGGFALISDVPKVKKLFFWVQIVLKQQMKVHRWKNLLYNYFGLKWGSQNLFTFLTNLNDVKNGAFNKKGNILLIECNSIYLFI